MKANESAGCVEIGIGVGVGVGVGVGEVPGGPLEQGTLRFGPVSRAVVAVLPGLVDCARPAAAQPRASLETLPPATAWPCAAVPLAHGSESVGVTARVVGAVQNLPCAWEGAQVPAAGPPSVSGREDGTSPNLKERSFAGPSLPRMPAHRRPGSC